MCRTPPPKTQTPEQLEALARELAEYDIVIATEVGGGVVPMDAEERAGREAAGRLACLLAARADCVVQMFCGIPTVLKGELPSMLIYLLRHGLTEYNAQKRYQGQRDIPLSAEGLRQLRRADIDPKVVYITPLQRTAQTARVLFPDAELVVVKDLQEMCFGSFEGKNYVEMEHDADYQAWVQANCESKCPDGERKDDFSDPHLQCLLCSGGQGAGRRRRAAGHPGPRRHPDGGDGAVRPAQARLLCVVRPQRGRLCAGRRRLGREAPAPPREDRAVHERRGGRRMMTVWAVLGGFVLDAIFGDPAWLPHPVVYMGKAISRLEKFLRARLPKTPQGELLGGAVLAFCLPVGTLLLTGLVCWGAAMLHPLLGLAVQMFWCGQALAAKGLVQESTNVYAELKKGSLPAARKAVSRIVGRDTEALTAEGVTKAAVETVAENASDGVIAPLLYMLLGGAPLALTYKAINTMDSMVGYKNEKYLYFGRAAAKLDDVANYIPSRLAALLWIMAAAFTRNDAKGAWRIWRRDRRNHASPNSAQTESACAGALGVQLAGPAYYFGEYYPKPTIGDPLRPIEPEDILRADRMMYVASGFALAFGCAIRGFLG